MELRELEYVTAIADAGSLSKAADRLYLAQSSLSQFLNRLESELGQNCLSGHPAVSVPHSPVKSTSGAPGRFSGNTG